MKNQTVDKLIVAYRRVGDERMRGLPFYNDRLSVEAVGFRTWKGRLLGVLITPWFMNLVLLAGAEDEWDRLPPGEAARWEFPSGKYELNPVRIKDVETYLSAALFSTVQDFPNQETARAVAEKVLTNLFQEARVEGDTSQHATRRKSVSRRDVFSKLLLAGD